MSEKSDAVVDMLLGTFVEGDSVVCTCGCGRRGVVVSARTVTVIGNQWLEVEWRTGPADGDTYPYVQEVVAGLCTLERVREVEP